MRHVVTLVMGALVGEIALLSDGEKRMATVRTAEPSVLLILDKKSFRELDSETLALISENAKYNKACTREPSARTADDLRILQARTQLLSVRFGHEAHLHLCGVMRFRKVRSALESQAVPQSPRPICKLGGAFRVCPHV